MKKEEQIEVTKIILKIGKKTIELTPQEMKELRDVIDETFPKERVKERIVIEDRPVYIPYPKPWIEPWPYKKWIEPVWRVNANQVIMCLATKS